MCAVGKGQDNSNDDNDYTDNDSDDDDDDKTTPQDDADGRRTPLLTCSMSPFTARLYCSSPCVCNLHGRGSSPGFNLHSSADANLDGHDAVLARHTTCMK